MVRLFAVIERDLRKFIRNPVVLAMSLIMPLLYLVILGNSFQGKLRYLPVALVNQDTGPYSGRLIKNLHAIEAGPKTFTIIKIQDHGIAINGVRAGRYKAAIIIPPDFSKRISLKGIPDIGLFLDNTDSISGETIRSLVAAAVGTIKTEYASVRERAEEIHTRSIDLYPKVDYYQSLIPGVVIMAIFLGTMTTGAFNLVMDRFLGIDESYLLTPLSKYHLVSGLIISSLFITTILAGIILTLSMLIAGIPLSMGFSQGISIFIVVVLTTLCLLSMMFVIMGRIGHPRIVGVLSGFLNVILFFPSGAVYPVESFPGWLKAFAMINPEAYAVDALKAILFKNAGIFDILTDITFLSVFTAVMMAIAIAIFKRTL